MDTTDRFPVAAAPFTQPSRLGEVMRFGAFPITETQAFPPPVQACCWTYLTLNTEIALSLPGNPALQALLRSPNVKVSVDGQWIWWALRRKYPQQPLAKLSGSDLIHLLAAHCAGQGQRLLLLGASPHANARALQNLRRRWPALHAAGYAPPQHETNDASETAMQTDAMDAIRAYSAQYVVLGMGASKEQRLALRLSAQLHGQVQGLLCFGGAIDLASGLERRAPPWVQRLGLECIYRALERPSRWPRLLRMLRMLPVLALGRY